MPKDRRRSGPSPCAIFLACLALAPVAASAQSIAGVVVDPTTGSPISEASVALLGTDGDTRRQALTDSVGSFVLEVGAGTRFYLEASRLGYVTTRSMLLEVGGGSTPPLTIELQPEPVALRGLKVAVEREAEEFLGLYGHTPETLGPRWITHEEIMAMPPTTGPYGILVRQAIPGVRLDSACGAMGECPRRLCVIQRESGGRAGCAQIFLNGVPIDSIQAQQITPSDLEAIAVLQPVDATTFFGTRATYGAVMLWTRRGR